MGRIRGRWGAAAVETASAAIERAAGDDIPDAYATGLPELDALTTVGGLPLGRISLCLGSAGSGKMLVAYRLLAAASQASVAVLLLDLRGHADPWLMSRLGVRLDRLLVLKGELQSALEGALALARAGVGAVVVDLPPGAGSAAIWDPYAAALAAACARESVPLLLLGEVAGPPLRYAASLVLRLQRREWVLRHGDVEGVRVLASVEKNKLGAPGASVEMVLRYPRGTFMAPVPRVGPGEAPALRVLSA